MTTKTGGQTDPIKDERAGKIREVGAQAIWSLSSCKPGFGVDQLRDDCMDTYWQSDGQLPHLVNIQFRQKTTVSDICIYTDYKLDESYTPSRVSIRAGTNFNDLQEVEVIDLNEPTGWVQIPTVDIRDRPIRTFMIQIAVISNHQNGRLEYNMIRVPIAASDFSLNYYTYDDVPGDVDLQYFNLTKDDYQIKIPIIKMAINSSKRGIKLIGSSWTAPNWMKTNNNYKLGYIYDKYLGVWANYHLKFLQAYRQNGLDFWAITQGNEVNIAWLFGDWFALPNTVFPPLVARYWTKKFLGPLLKPSDFKNVKILAMDDERAFMGWYMDRMLADPESSEYIDGVAVHWYLDSNSNLQNLKHFHDKYPDKMILYTEASISFFNGGGGKSVMLGDWDRAQMYIENIITNLNNWVVSYIDWNIVLNDDGGPSGPANLTLDATVIVNKTSGEFYKQPLFFAMGHFSKFILPGSQKIEVTVNQPFEVVGQFEFGSDETESSSTAPFPTRKPEPPATKVMALGSSNPDGSYTVVVYNPHSEPVNLIIKDCKVGVLNKTVEEKSLNTFVYW